MSHAALGVLLSISNEWAPSDIMIADSRLLLFAPPEIPDTASAGLLLPYGHCCVIMPPGGLIGLNSARSGALQTVDTGDMASLGVAPLNHPHC